MLELRKDLDTYSIHRLILNKTLEEFPVCFGYFISLVHSRFVVSRLTALPYSLIVQITLIFTLGKGYLYTIFGNRNR